MVETSSSGSGEGPGLATARGYSTFPHHPSRCRISVVVSTTPSVGQVARVRSRRYLVESVSPPPSSGDQTRVALSCLDDDAQGERLEVLWEREIDAEAIPESDW